MPWPTCLGLNTTNLRNNLAMPLHAMHMLKAQEMSALGYMDQVFCYVLPPKSGRKTTSARTTAQTLLAPTRGGRYNLEVMEGPLSCITTTATAGTWSGVTRASTCARSTPPGPRPGSATSMSSVRPSSSSSSSATRF